MSFIKIHIFIEFGSHQYSSNSNININIKKNPNNIVKIQLIKYLSKFIESMGRKMYYIFRDKQPLHDGC